MKQPEDGQCPELPKSTIWVSPTCLDVRVGQELHFFFLDERHPVAVYVDVNISMITLVLIHPHKINQLVSIHSFPFVQLGEPHIIFGISKKQSNQIYSKSTLNACHLKYLI